MTAVRARGRVTWGLIDQVVSSASNFVVLVLAARALPASGFGVFALGMAACIVATAISRGVTSDPLATSHAADQPTPQRRAVRDGAAAVIWPALAVGVTAAALGASVGGSTGALILAFGAVLPGLLLQDYLRFALIVRGRADHTCLNDLAWLVAVVPALLLVATRDGGPAAMLFAWGAAGSLAAVLGLVQVGSLPGAPRRMRRWLREKRSLWPYYLADNLVHQVSAVGMLAAIAVVASTADVGGVRAAMTVYAPLTLLSRGVLGVAVPELARRHAAGAQIRRLTLRLATGMALLGVLCALATVLIPDALGMALLGDSWRLAEPVLLLAGAVPIVGLFSSGIVVGVRAIGAARHGLGARLVAAVVVVGAATGGAWWDGIHGVFVLLAVTAPLQLTIWYVLLVTAHRDTVAPPVQEADAR